MSVWLIVMVALILSPNRCALGQAVIKSEKVPDRIKESIGIESGLNDGIALPLILICIAVLVEGSSAIDFSGEWMIFMVQQLTLGPLVGTLVGWIGGSLLEKPHQKTRWNTHFKDWRLFRWHSLRIPLLNL